MHFKRILKGASSPSYCLLFELQSLLILRVLDAGFHLNPVSLHNQYNLELQLIWQPHGELSNTDLMLESYLAFLLAF